MTTDGKLMGKVIDLVRSMSSALADTTISVDKSSSTYYNNEKQQTASASLNGKVDPIEYSKQETQLNSINSDISPMENSSTISKSPSKVTATTSTLGKYSRSLGLTFLGTKFKTFTCKECNKKYEDIGLGKRPTSCPLCDNHVNVYDTDNGCNCYSCMAGRAMRKARNEDNI